MQCKFCSNAMPDDSVFCPTCGKQIDGKNVCSKCGKIFDGEYCNACGTRLIKKQSKTVYERFCAVEKILSPTTLLFMLFVLFICSLFIGVTVTESVGGTTSSVSMTTFWFFGDVYSNLSSTGKPYSANIIFAIFCTIAMATNIVASFLSLITGAIKYGRSISKGQHFSLARNAGLSITTFFIATAMACGMGINGNEGSLQYATSLSGGTVLGILIIAISIGLVAVLRQISLRKNVLNYYNLCSLIMVAVVFSLIMGLSFTVCEDYSSIISSGINVRFSIFQFANFVSALFIDGVSASITAYAVLSVLAQVSLMVVTALIIRAFVLSLTEGTPVSRNVLILSIIALCLAVLYGVFGILCVSDSSVLIINSYGGLTKSSFPKTGFILTLIIGVIQCVASVFYYFLMRREVK